MTSKTQQQAAAAADAHPRPEGWWAYPPLYVLVVYIGGHLPGLPWWMPVAIGVALAGIGWAVARQVWHPTDYGAGVAGGVACCLAGAGLGAGAWLYAAQARGPLAVWQYLAAGAGVGWAWWALVMLLAPKAAAAVDALWAVTPAAADNIDPKLARYRAVLAQLVPDVEVLDITTSSSGGVDTVRITPAAGRDVTRAGFEAKLPRIVTMLARLYAAEGVELQDEDVAVEAGPHAALWHLLVTTTRVLARTIPYEPAAGPQPWVGPKQMGYWEDDQPLHLTTCHEAKGAAHGDIVAATGEGKTNILNNIIRRHLESDEGEVWLIGMEKLVKLAWMWLLPWLRGQTDRPVIDRVAGEDIEACLRALADAFQYAALSNRKQRGNRARRPKRGRGGLLLILDEKAHLLGRGETIRCFDGVERNASQVVAALVKLGRTAPVSVISANQDKLMGSAGVAGPEQSRNQSIGIVGKVTSGYDAWAAVPGLSARMNPMTLTDNAIYQVSPHDARREVRGKYFFIDDDEIPAAAAELTRYRYGLDPAITSQLRYYADRWERRWHTEFLAELEEETELTWPVGATVAPAAATEPDPPAGTLDEPTPEPVLVPPARTTDPDSDPDTEETTVAAADDTPPEGLPDGWGDPAFDIWAALGAADGGGDAVRVNKSAAHTGGAVFPAADISGIEAALAKARAFHEAHPPRRLREPLESVLYLLAKPGAPEWVPTEVLALALGRITPEMERGERDRAIAKLGLDLWRQTEIRSEQLRKEHDARQRKGYRASDLVEAGRRLRDAA